MKNKIEYNITIAIAMLDRMRMDRYGNGRVTHCERKFVTSTVTNLLNDVLIEIVKQADSNIPKNKLKSTRLKRHKTTTRG